MPWAVYYANILYAWPCLAAYIEQLDLLIPTVERTGEAVEDKEEEGPGCNKEIVRTYRDLGEGERARGRGGGREAG